MNTGKGVSRTMSFGNFMNTTRVFNHHVNIAYSVLITVDALLFFASCYLAAWFYFLPQPQSLAAYLSGLAPKAALFSAVTVLALFSMGLYQPRLRETAAGVVLRVTGGFLLMTIAIALVNFFFTGFDLWRGLFIYAAGIAFAACLTTRVVFSRLVELNQLKRNILILGAGSAADNIANRMRRKSDRRGFRVLAYANVSDCDPGPKDAPVIYLEKGALFDYVLTHQIHQIVVALDDHNEDIPTDELVRCRILGVSIINMLDFFEQEAGKVLVDQTPPEWLIFAGAFKGQSANGLGKRAFDVFASLCLLSVTWPVLLLAILAIKLEDGARAPVFFRQRRVGLNGQVFDVLKLRSMTVNAEGDGKARWAKSHDPRVTRVGTFIRKTRIDELPQIINVLLGHMAFVGPRPERPEFIEELSSAIPYFNERHCVKPGITGWAQLNYPYGSSIEDAKHKLEFDLYYVKNQSLFLDFLILLQTVEVILFGKGAR